MPRQISAELIVGTQRVCPVSLESFDGGVVAALSGSGLLCVLDATFAGDGAIQLWSLGAQPRAMTVTDIAMRGRSTFVTLQDAAAPIRAH